MTQNESQGSAGREIPQETRLGPFLPAEERPPKRARTDLYEHDDRDPSSVSPTPVCCCLNLGICRRQTLINLRALLTLKSIKMLVGV